MDQDSTLSHKDVHCAFQGETGAFSEVAAEKLFPGSRTVAKPSFEAVFEAVVSEEVDCAVIPIENSLFGSVHINFDLLREHDVRITGETSVRVRHFLMGLEGTPLDDIRQVHSHPQALGQCRDWLRRHIPSADLIPAYDTAGAARMLKAMRLSDAAAIASKRAASEYGLEILAEGIESNPNNYTRFLALRNGRNATEMRQPSIPYKTTIQYSLRENVPGVLFKTLAVFALREIDLIKIESRPLVGSPGNYLFYIDVIGHSEDEPLNRALSHLAELSPTITLLGSYPVG